MTYNTEAIVKQVMGIDSFRNLSKDKIFQLLAMWPDVDKDVAKENLHQVPELASLSKAALTDIEATYRATLDASSQSAKALSDALSNELAMIGAALESDPTNEALWRWRRELLALMAAKDTEVREFSGRMYETKVFEKVAVVAVVAAALLVGFKSGGRASGGFGQVIAAVRDAA